jgi:adenine/guanine phosphoribosyltransferase-like PRPP-binding protein
MFLWRVLLYFSLRKAIDYYKEVHGNYYVNCFVKRFYVLTDKRIIGKVFRSSPRLTMLNRAFTNAHGMAHTIDSVEETDPTWNIIHSSVKSTILGLGDTPISLLNEMFETHVRNSFTQKVDILELFDEVFKRWFYIVFIGHEPEEQIGKRNAEEVIFYDIRKSLLKTLNSTFYSNPFRTTPFIGPWISSHRRIQHQLDIDKLQSFFHLYTKERVNVFPDSFYAQFKDRISSQVNIHYANEDETFKENMTHQIFINNGLLTLLVYDFLHLMLKGAVVAKIEKAVLKTEKTEHDIDTVLNDNDILNVYRKNFLFRYRGRTLTKGVEYGDTFIPRGSIVLADLVGAELFYSVGRRGCPGQAIARPMIKSFVQMLNKISFIVDDSDIHYGRNNDVDTPFIEGSAYGYAYYRDQLVKSSLIPSRVGLNGIELRNLWHLYSDSNLLGMIQAWIQSIQKYFEWHGIQIDTIIAPEARALPLCSMFENTPIVVLTKTDKFGPTQTANYERGYADNIATIHLYETLVDTLKNKRIILIDDGIASGGTLNASIDLIESNSDSRVNAIAAIINHTYAETEPNITKRNIVTMFDF